MPANQCRPRAEVQLEEMAIFIHGVLFSFHVLGVIYNLRRRNKLDVVAHSCAAFYDAHAVAHHLASIRGLE